MVLQIKDFLDKEVVQEAAVKEGLYGRRIRELEIERNATAQQVERLKLALDSATKKTVALKDFPKQGRSRAG